jgi:hypothetical protein
MEGGCTVHHKPSEDFNLQPQDTMTSIRIAKIKKQIALNVDGAVE